MSTIHPSIQKYLNQFFSEKLNLPNSWPEFRSVGGGSINDTYQLFINNQARFFLKINSADKYPRLLEKEKNGLEFLASQKIAHTPQVIVCDTIDKHQILVLEWIEKGLQIERFWGRFGEQLAALHHVTNSYFGFQEDNYMGALPQRNRHYNSWIEFFVHCRLQPQIELATIKHLLHEKLVTAFEHLYEELENIFNDEQPSLLHGDLWSGNFMCNQESEPVLIDPAIYFGHRSMDLAMTTLFGGFERSFYESYNYHFPFPGNYTEQWDICNLYPLLIHLNLFGEGYLPQIERILQVYM
jgi:fructosamine-3-kinase